MSMFRVFGVCLLMMVCFGCVEPPEQTKLPTRLSVVSEPLQVGRYRHQLWVVRDSETETEYIVITETDGTAICPVSRNTIEMDR